MLIAVATVRVVSGLGSSVKGLFTNVGVLSWDFLLAVLNIFAFNRPVNRVVPKGAPGYNGLWPEYHAPQEGDSRCSCPALNALANHGVLPRDGKNITFRQLNAVIRSSYNFAPSFCYFVPNTIATILRRNYSTDTFDLSDIDVHNGIEHDASLCREDSIFTPDQSKPAVKLIERLLSSGTGKNGDLTPADLSKLLGQRRVESKRDNPQFSLAFNHKMFSSSNGSTLLTIFGGKIEDIRPFLLEERLPEGWQSRIRHPFGLTIAAFNSTVFKVELGVKEELPGALDAAAKKNDTEGHLVDVDG